MSEKSHATVAADVRAGKLWHVECRDPPPLVVCFSAARAQWWDLLVSQFRAAEKQKKK